MATNGFFDFLRIHQPFFIVESWFLILRVLRLFVYPVKFEDHFTGAVHIIFKLKKLFILPGMIFKTPIKTSRLLLRKESLQDFERFYSMSIDPEVMQYIGDGSVYHWTKQVALGKYKDTVSKKNNNVPGNLAVYRKDRDLYIGWCGVCYSKFLDHIELTYRFCRDSWCKGYTTEAAEAILTTIYKNTDIDKILACTHPENTASIRVLEKLGFNYSYPKLSKPIGKDIPVYKLDRKTFMHARHTEGKIGSKV